MDPAPSVREPPRIRRVRLRRLRRITAALIPLLPTAWILGTDLLRRADRIAKFDRLHLLGYLGSIVGSAILWGAMLFVASRRRGSLRTFVSVLFVVLYTLAAGVEAAFHSFYNIYLSIDGQLHSKSIPWSIVGTLPLTRPSILFHIGLAAGLALLFLRLARRRIRAGKWPSRILFPLVLASLVVVTKIPVSYRTVQSTSFDLIYFHGIVALVKERLGYTHDSPDLRVQRRTPMSVPKLTAKPARPRNVVLIVQESQRFDVTCNEYDPKCDLATRFSNAASPGRMALNQVRANDSTTAISISNLWSGVRPDEGRDLLHSVPLIWDFAHAAGYDTAYWTSQNLMFGNARLYVQDISVSHRCVATDLDSESDLDCGARDALVTKRALEDLKELKEPYFAVVHYSNIHFPYVYDPKFAPFQPASLDKSADKNEEFKNFYKDVVYFSDKAVGEFIDGLRATDAGKRTVVVYTSDHGEAFREHWQLGHTSATYDEEIHVPGWVDAPEGTLTPEEEENIKAAKDEFVYHLDFMPTFLDLLGIWDDAPFKPFRSRMMGHPLTRRERTLGPVPLANCTWVWECSFRNWGMMQGPMKIVAREWDGEYHCFNVLDDPEELNNLGEEACTPLPDQARAIYRVLPNQIPPGRPIVDWGRK